MTGNVTVGSGVTLTINPGVIVKFGTNRYLTVSGDLVAVGTVATVPWLARETMLSTLHDAGTLLQVARMEAVRLNHGCRFIVDPAARTMTVVDGNGTASTSVTVPTPGTSSISR